MELLNKSKTKHNYPDSFVHNDIHISNNESIANNFNDYFVNVGSNLASKIPATHTNFLNFLKGSYPNSFVFYPTYDTEIFNIMMNLNPNKSPGPDNIDPLVCKLAAEPHTPIHTHIFNQSMEVGRVPDQLKIAKVIPIFKNDDNSKFSNYRPISILQIFSKVLEKIVYTRLLNYLTKFNILCDNQFGFRKNHSTFMAVLELVDNLSNSMDRKEFSVGVFIDLSKAFDTVNHKILLEKLLHYGIRGTPLNWFSDYLSNRKQFVKFNDTLSEQKTISCGVPQGSILGPLLFLIYINDISNCSSLLKIILNADDTSIFYSGKDLDQLLQSVNLELVKLSIWFKANKLSLNLKKTKSMIFCSRTKRYTKNIDIMIDNQIIEQVRSLTFLGVHIHEHLDWKPHINIISLKTSKSIGAINKIKSLISATARRTLYCSLVLPYIQYCNIIWANTYSINLEKIFKNSLIIHEENTKKNHKRVVSLYVDKDFPSFT